MRWDLLHGVAVLAVLSVGLLMPHNAASTETTPSNFRVVQLSLCCEEFCPKPLPLECIRRPRGAVKPKPKPEAPPPCKRRSDGDCER
jgi:hypothetical protein